MNLRGVLARSRDAIASRLEGVFGHGRTLDAAALAEAEEALLESDLGLEAAEKAVSLMSVLVERSGMPWRDALRRALAEGFPVPPSAPRTVDRPEVVLVVGVNGSGKTTTIARLARLDLDAGRRVLLVCADTFRAAAAEQLEKWGGRLGVETLTRPPGTDPGAAAWDGIRRALASGADTVFVDTAGRLPNRRGLMDELSKIHRVCGKAMAGAPHRSLLVLDASVGQSVMTQAERFGEALPLTGLVLTKLDGTARGGSVLAMAHRLSLPIDYVGTGEGERDLATFDHAAFLEALVGGG